MKERDKIRRDCLAFAKREADAVPPACDKCFARRLTELSKSPQRIYDVFEVIHLLAYIAQRGDDELPEIIDRFTYKFSRMIVLARHLNKKGKPL